MGRYTQQCLSLPVHHSGGKKMNMFVIAVKQDHFLIFQYFVTMKLSIESLGHFIDSIFRNIGFETETGGGFVSSPTIYDMFTTNRQRAYRTPSNLCRKVALRRLNLNKR